jgi:hypothetical protein
VRLLRTRREHLISLPSSRGASARNRPTHQRQAL